MADDLGIGVEDVAEDGGPGGIQHRKGFFYVADGDGAVTHHQKDCVGKVCQDRRVLEKAAGRGVEDDAVHLGAELPEAQALWKLYPVMDSALDAAGGRALYHDIELPLCSVLARMEEKGFLVDRKALADFGESLTAGIDAL